MRVTYRLPSREDEDPISAVYLAEAYGSLHHVSPYPVKIEVDQVEWDRIKEWFKENGGGFEDTMTGMPLLFGVPVFVLEDE